MANDESENQEQNEASQPASPAPEPAPKADQSPETPPAAGSSGTDAPAVAAASPEAEAPPAAKAEATASPEGDAGAPEPATEEKKSDSPDKSDTPAEEGVPTSEEGDAKSGEPKAEEKKPEEKKPEEKKPEEKKPEVDERGRPKRKDIFASIESGEEEKPKILKAKGSKNVHTGIVHVQATFNNTIVSVTDQNGNLIGWSSSGKLGFRGSRKSTAYAAQLVSQDACRQGMSHGLKEAEVRVKGPGSGREAAVRAVQAIGIDVTVIKDVTPIPHNGCRPPKARRV